MSPLLFVFGVIFKPFVLLSCWGVPLTIAYWPLLLSSPTSDSVVIFSKVMFSPVSSIWTLIWETSVPSLNSLLMIAFGLYSLLICCVCVVGVYGFCFGWCVRRCFIV